MLKQFCRFGTQQSRRPRSPRHLNKRWPTHRSRLGCEPLEVRRLLAGDVVGDFHPDQFLVRFTDEAAAESYLAGTKVGDQLGFGFYEVYVDADVGLEQAVEHYNQLPGVEYAQRDFVLEYAATVPDDASFDSLWGLHNTGQTGGTNDADIDAVEAWDVETDASSIIVAVIDTGVDYTHQDLAANIWVNATEAGGDAGVDDDGNGYTDDIYGYDFYNEDGDPFDDNGHGTHVSGTIGAVGDNDIGITGVTWHVQLMGLKFLSGSGSGYTSDAVRAVDYAREMGANVINASFGGGGYSTAMYDAIEAFGDAGGIFVAAAGNAGNDNDSDPSYPASYDLPNIIAVAASDNDDELASWSNYGTASVDIAAPGVSILSTLPDDDYGTASGTSMATPHVVGAAALVWAAHPEWSNEEVIASLLDYADPILLDAVADGRLNVNEAIQVSLGDTDGPRVTDSTWSGEINRLEQLTVTFNESIDAETLTAADIEITDPDGNPIRVSTVSEVRGSGGKEFEISFSEQSSSGTYQAVLGPQVTDQEGNLMDQDRDGVQGESEDDQYSSTANIKEVLEYKWEGRKALRDRRTTTVKFRVRDDVTIEDIDVRVDLKHTWDSDLQLILVSPDKTRVRLFNRSGGSGDDILATFDDEARTKIADGSAPFDGAFQPDRSLSKLDGESTKGTWKLRIRDRAAGDVGTIYGVTLIVTPDNSASSSSISPIFSPRAEPFAAGLDPRVWESTASAPAAGRWRGLEEATVDTPRADWNSVLGHEDFSQLARQVAVERGRDVTPTIWSSYHGDDVADRWDAWDDTLALLGEAAS
ncbi:MAG: hypothetical protein CMJ59_00105 [Planctomycetaceae bacterium]|nr:hypothetical protein [Planctomycetaceae bacterium]